MRLARSFAFVAASSLLLLAGARCSPSRFDGLTGGSNAPRLIAPLSGSYAFSQDVTLKWELPRNVHDVDVDVCVSRDCSSVETTHVHDASSAKIHFAAGFDHGVEFPEPRFWRLRTDTVTTPPWLVTIVPARNKDVSWGCVCDLNGDGQAETVVGLPGDNQVVVAPSSFLDRPGVADPEICLPFEAPRPVRTNPDVTGLGTAVAVAGDVDGDGLGDIVATTSGVGLGHARVFVYFGGEGAQFLRPNGDRELVTTPAKLQYGRFVAGGGDIDGDGYADVVVSDDDSVHVFWGSASGPTTATRVTIDPLVTGGGTLCALANVGDLDGDGLADSAVSWNCFGDGGKVAVVFGSRDRAHLVVKLLETPEGAAGFGTHVSLAGDLDLDGRSEVFVGAPASNTGYVFASSTDRNLSVLARFSGVSGSKNFGSASTLGLEPFGSLGQIWVGSDSDVSLVSRDGGANSMRDVYPFMPLDGGRVNDLAINFLGPPYLSIAAPSRTIGIRNDCDDAGGFEGATEFASSTGNVVFAR